MKKMLCWFFPVLVVFFIITTAFNKRNSKATYIYIPTDSLKTGDIILRESHGVLSELFKSFSLKERKYSHAGFVNCINGDVYVSHFIDDHSGVTCEKLDDFITQDKCKSFAVYHPLYSQDQSKEIVTLINDSHNKLISFDSKFDLATDDAMYCTEWIYKSLNKVNIHLEVTKSSSGDYIAPDNLYINNFVKKIYEATY